MKKIESVSLFGTLPPIKGISGFCIEQANCLSKKLKVEFHSFSSIYPEFLYPGGTKEYSKVFTIKENKNLRIKRVLSWYNPFSWIYVGLTNRGKIVHINWWIYLLFPVFFTIAILSKLRGKKVILTLHNVIAHESNFLDSLFSSIMYSVSDILLVHTENNKDTLIKKFKINKNKIHLIPYGPLNFFKTKNISQSEAKKHLGLKDKNKIILFFGTIRKYKGLDILIKAFAKVSRALPNVRLIIAGENWIEWKPYETLINKYHLQDKIISHIRYIPSEEIQYYFTAADLVVLPYTHFDAQSAVGNVTVAFNKPIIASSVSGIKDSLNTYTFANKNIKELSGLIKTFFLFKKIGNCKCSNYNSSWDNYLKKYLKIISK